MPGNYINISVKVQNIIVFIYIYINVTNYV